MAGQFPLEDPQRTEQMKRHARKLLDQGLSSDAVRKACATKFNLTERKVTLRLMKRGINVKVNAQAKRAKSATTIYTLDEDGRKNLIADAKKMMADGTPGDAIRDALARAYKIHGPSVVRFLNGRGVDIHNQKPISIDVGFAASENLFDKAARVVGARFDPVREVYWIGREPVNGLRLVQRAGMELPQ